MTDQAYFVQSIVHARLTGDMVLTALVPAASIADFSGVPTLFPSIVMGEAQIVDEGQRIDRSVVRVYLTLHIWTKEPYLNQVKKVGGALRNAMQGRWFPAVELWNNSSWWDGVRYQIGDMRIDDTRYMRDPSGKNGHGVVTVNALVGRV